jgi:uncharacterized membrane protein YtjA (UPF0391 family)
MAKKCLAAFGIALALVLGGGGLAAGSAGTADVVVMFPPRCC